jgi:fucose permease
MGLRLVLAFAGFVLIGLGGGASGVLLPAQIDYYGLDKSVVGVLFVAFSLGYVLAGAANGALLRRLGVRGHLVLGTSLFALATGGCAVLPPYPLFVVLTALFGIGAGVIDSGLNAFVATLPRHTSLLNFLHAFFGVGALAGPVLAVALLDAGFSWGSVYLVFSVCSLPLLVGFALRLPGATVSEPDPVRVSAFGAAVRHRAIVLAAAFLALYVGVEVNIGNWGYSFLVEERGEGAILAGWVISGYWFGFTAGRFLLNALAERAGVGPVALTFGCLGGVALSTGLVWLAPADAAVVVGLAALGFFLGPVFPLTIAVLPRLAPAWLVPTAIGVLVGVSVVGGAFFPWLAGTAAHHLGLGTLLPFTLALVALLLANWWRIARRVAPI